MAIEPGYAHLHATKPINTETNNWLRDKLYRDTAPVPSTNFCAPGLTRGHLPALYRDTHAAQEGLCHDGQKLRHTRRSYLPGFLCN